MCCFPIRWSSTLCWASPTMRKAPQMSHTSICFSWAAASSAVCLSQCAVSESLSRALRSSFSWSHSFITPWASSTLPSQPSCSTC
uniref:Putative secreted protein n=1 Tax=Ixodes ricinus TaxID=34613 RepID=A0A6B0U900_IXORI